MTITRQDFEQLEAQLDVFAKNKALKSPEAKPYLDDYFDMIMRYFEQVNGIEGSINFSKLAQYPVVPMNFEERYHYMIERKYHFMGYRQMKTLKSELIKMNASYQTRLKIKNQHK